MTDFIAKRRELACLIEDIFDEFENDPTDCDVNTYLASKLLDAGYDKRESSEPVKRGRSSQPNLQGTFRSKRGC